ncbi:Nucleotidyltransferase DNA polymerase for DNA repair [Lactobacillus hominis DSM 23910 = CRBIP 24.179]|nr:Nucleotidyltransferase DNA polymerase for DNA repair [Lactobacillus hominis DSM 23910 = CRBIP 24.179]
MASSPLAKKKYGLKNVMRQRNLPPKEKTPGLYRVDPHMNLYIKKAMQIKEIFLKYCAPEDLHTYSIDESMLDMTKSWHLFGKEPYEVARKIQKEIHDTLGLYTTCGIGENPLLAKLAMDISAKHRLSMIDFWHYVEVPDTVWKIKNLEDVWGINTRTADHLRRIGINNMYELAHSDPTLLHREFGIIGDQLFAMSWGVDRSIISQKYHPKSKSYSNSQVLARDYTNQREIEIVIREIGEQVAARIRAHHFQTKRITLFIGYSLKQRAFNDHRGGFVKSETISPTNSNKELTTELIALFRKKWQGETVREIGVDFGKLIPDTEQQLSLFSSVESQIKQFKFDRIVDSVRHNYGFTSLVKASSLLPGATAIERSNLVGGHNGGNAYE